MRAGNSVPLTGGTTPAPFQLESLSAERAGRPLLALWWLQCAGQAWDEQGGEGEGREEW